MLTKLIKLHINFNRCCLLMKMIVVKKLKLLINILVLHEILWKTL